jgi:outer membrane protein with beta-barrel domain
VKRLPCIFILTMALLWAAPAFASDFGLFGSYWNTRDADDAFGGGLEVNFAFGQSPLGLELRGTYYQQLSDDAVGNLFEPDEGFFEENSLEAIPVEAGLRYNFNPTGNVSPWISGGVSYIFLDISDIEGAEVDDETGWYAGLGSRFGQSEGINFFGEVLYRATEATVNRRRSDVDLQDHVNIELDGLVVNAGVMWNF